MHAALIAAGDWFEILAAVIVFLITGIAQWLQSRSRKKRGLPQEPLGEVLEETWPPANPQPAPPRESPKPRPALDLEEQLRRLFEPEPEPEPVEPPPIRQAPPRLPPTPEPESEGTPGSNRPSRPVHTLEEASAAYAKGASVESKVARRLSAAGDFSRTANAMLNAQGLSESIATRLRDHLDRTTSTPRAQSHARTPGNRTTPAGVHNPATLASVLRKPASARQALLVSILIQPPKALETSPFQAAPTHH